MARKITVRCPNGVEITDDVHTLWEFMIQNNITEYRIIWGLNPSIDPADFPLIVQDFKHAAYQGLPPPYADHDYLPHGVIISPVMVKPDDRESRKFEWSPAHKSPSQPVGRPTRRANPFGPGPAPGVWEKYIEEKLANPTPEEKAQLDEWLRKTEARAKEILAEDEAKGPPLEEGLHCPKCGFEVWNPKSVEAFKGKAAWFTSCPTQTCNNEPFVITTRPKEVQ